MCELAGRPEVPVHAGRMKPLAREAIDAAYIHGETGLDGVELPEPSRPLAEQHAVAYVIDPAPRPDAALPGRRRAVRRSRLRDDHSRHARHRR